MKQSNSYHPTKHPAMLKYFSLVLFLFLSSVVHAQTWVQIAQGSVHTMAIRSDGTLWAWGANGSGQLGIGNTNPASWPVQVDASTNWKQVSCGWVHTVAVKTDGTIWAWGDNTYGQLGIGNTTQQNSPVQVGVLTSWSTVSCGEHFTMAIRTNGTLWGWGENGSGSLGDGSNTQRNSPVQESSLSTTWSKLSCGLFQTLAIKTNGTLWATGNNAYGQLGLGNTTFHNTFVQVGAATIWKQVFSMYNHSAAVKTDGTLWAWGDNTYGQLGIGSTTQQNSPVQVGALTTWNAVAGGSNTTMAIKTDNTLWSAGVNNLGQLGLGNTTNSTTFQQVSGASVLLNTGLSDATGDMFGYISGTGTSICETGSNSIGGLGQGGFGGNALTFNCANSLAAICSNYPVTPATTNVISNVINTSGNNSTLDFIYPGCYSILKLESLGASPVSGLVNVLSWVEPSLPLFNGVPYLARHYQITPSTNPSTATGTVTLYCLQSEFNAYNAGKPSNYPSMPTSTSDMVNAANVRVTKISGTTSNGTGLPGTYTSGTGVVITPSSILYNASQSRWEIRFPVTGFSGFFIHTNPWMVALPIKLEEFSAQAGSDCKVTLNWKIAEEESGDRLMIEHSEDGTNWQTLGEANVNTSENVYTDDSPSPGKNYYRLLLEDITGNKNYSQVETVNLNCREDRIRVYPTVTAGQVTIEVPVEDKNLVITVTGMDGRSLPVAEQYNGTTCHLDMASLPPGIYTIIVSNIAAGISYHTKVVKH